MDANEFVWDHFKFNASQRLTSFNFFIVLSIFAGGGFFASVEKGMHPWLIVILGAFIILLSIVFWLVDKRSHQLLSITIPAMKRIEEKFPRDSRLFSIDAKAQGKYVRYTFAFRLLIWSQLIFGAGILIFGVHKLMC